MNEPIPALVIFCAVGVAAVMFTLLQTDQPPTVFLVMCPVYTEPTHDEAAEPQPTTEAEPLPGALNFDLPE